MRPRAMTLSTSTKVRAALSAAASIAVVLCLTGSPACADDGSIGLYADAQGTVSHASFAYGQPTTLYVVAHLAGATAPGVNSVEFRITDFPQDWFAALTPNPTASIVLGNPLRVQGGVHRANMVFSGCVWTEPLVLYTIFVIPSSSPATSTMRVEVASPPSNPGYTSPVFLLCDYPNYTPVAAVGGTFTIDAVRMPQGLDYSLAPGYDGVRGVQPIAGLPGETFRFRAAYSQINGLQLPAGQPLLQLDGNGDGDSSDPGEGTYVLVPADHDSTTVDGKDYLVDVALPAAPNGRWRYRFSAVNAQGTPATGPATAWNDSLFVAPSFPDLVVHPEDLTCGPISTDPREPRQISIPFTNDSDVALTDVLVRVEESTGNLLVERTFPHVAPRATGIVTFPNDFVQSGVHVVVVRLDPGHTIPERDETNNVATRSILIAQTNHAGAIGLDMFPVSFQDPPLQPFHAAGHARYSGLIRGGTPAVAGAQVTWTPSWDAAVESRTDSTGEFEHEFIAPAAPGMYSITVSVSDGALLTKTTTVPVQVTGTMALHGPDLVPELALVPPNPCPGETQSVQWSVRNAGDVASVATTVRLEVDGNWLADQAIGSLAPGASVALPATGLGAAATGAHCVTARVDPANAIAELHEENGVRAVRCIVPIAGPDLAVESVRFETGPCAGATLAMQVGVVNRGCAASAATYLALRVDGAELARWNFGSLAPGASQVASIDGAFPAPNCHLLEFAIDPDAVPGANQDPARDVLPVQACMPVCTLPPNSSLNYHVENCDLRASNPHPGALQPVQFSVHVTNTGFSSAIAPVAVRFYVGSNPVGNDVLVGPLAGGQTVEVQSGPWLANFTPTAVRAVVDPNNVQPETDEQDNVAQKAAPYELSLAQIDMCPPASPSMFSSCSPCALQPVAIRGVIVNTGIFYADSVQVEFGITGPVDSLLGRVIATGASVPAACDDGSAPSGSVPVEVTFRPPIETTYHITLRVDPAGRWPEPDETNNTRTRDLQVLCGDKPDLTVAVAWPNDLDLPPGTTITSTPLRVRNLGSAAATGVRVRLKLDGASLCEDLAVGDLAPYASMTVSCDVPWVVSEDRCALRLEACVDPLNTVFEINETNNCSSAASPNGSSDLRPNTLSVIPAQRTAGQVVSINVEILNQLPGAAIGNVTVFSYRTEAQYIGSASVVADPSGWVSIPWVFDPSVYYLWVMVENVCPRDIDAGNNSMVFSVNGSPPGTPVVLSDLTATSTEEGVRLAWRAPLEAVRFEVQWRDAASDAWQRLAVSPQPGAHQASGIEWSLQDDGVPLGAHRAYQVISVEANGTRGVAGTVEITHANGRTSAWLEPARPQPFRSGGVLAFSLPRAANAAVVVYDAAGRRVASPYQATAGAGRHEIRWDARGDNGRRLPAGVYFVELRALGNSRVQRIVLVP